MSYIQRVSFVVALAAGVLAGPQADLARAQQGSTISGKLVDAVTRAPVVGAVVTLEGTTLTTTSRDGGTYRLSGVSPGSYRLVVTGAGFIPSRKTVDIGATPLMLDVELDPQLHFTDIVSVSPNARDQFESYQPTTVLAGQDLYKQLQGTLGSTLAVQPGVAERSFGPGPSRPVIRGLDGDRVLILEDGQRMGDLSSQSGDHGVTVNPASANRIEVVRGPAALLYGANAIGGLVNAITNEIPRGPVNGASGDATFDLGTAASEGGAAGDVTVGNGRFAFHASGSGRRSGDVDTPEGTIENTQSRYSAVNLGGAWTSDRGYLGASYGYDDSKYGIPLVEEGNVQLTPRRHSVTVRAEGREFSGPISSVRASVGVRRYRHDELEGDEVGTQFKNNIADVQFLANHRKVGALSGTIGVSGLTRSFEATGEEALSPPVDQTDFAAFLY
jgi:iron complex outermembrane receptor protein